MEEYIAKFLCAKGKDEEGGPQGSCKEKFESKALNWKMTSSQKNVLFGKPKESENLQLSSFQKACQGRGYMNHYLKRRQVVPDENSDRNSEQQVCKFPLSPKYPSFLDALLHRSQPESPLHCQKLATPFETPRWFDPEQFESSFTFGKSRSLDLASDGRRETDEFSKQGKNAKQRPKSSMSSTIHRTEAINSQTSLNILIAKSFRFKNMKKRVFLEWRSIAKFCCFSRHILHEKKAKFESQLKTFVFSTWKPHFLDYKNREAFAFRKLELYQNARKCNFFSSWKSLNVATKLFKIRTLSKCFRQFDILRIWALKRLMAKVGEALKIWRRVAYISFTLMDSRLCGRDRRFRSLQFFERLKAIFVRKRSDWHLIHVFRQKVLFRRFLTLFFELRRANFKTQFISAFLLRKIMRKWTTFAFKKSFENAIICKISLNSRHFHYRRFVMAFRELLKVAKFKQEWLCKHSKLLFLKWKEVADFECFKIDEFHKNMKKLQKLYVLKRFKELRFMKKLLQRVDISRTLKAFRGWKNFAKKFTNFFLPQNDYFFIFLQKLMFLENARFEASKNFIVTSGRGGPLYSQNKKNRSFFFSFSPKIDRHSLRFARMSSTIQARLQMLLRRKGFQLWRLWAVKTSAFERWLRWRKAAKSIRKWKLDVESQKRLALFGSRFSRLHKKRIVGCFLARWVAMFAAICFCRNITKCRIFKNWKRLTSNRNSERWKIYKVGEYYGFRLQSHFFHEWQKVKVTAEFDSCIESAFLNVYFKRLLPKLFNTWKTVLLAAKCDLTVREKLYLLSVSKFYTVWKRSFLRKFERTRIAALLSLKVESYNIFQFFLIWRSKFLEISKFRKAENWEVSKTRKFIFYSWKKKSMLG